MPTFTPLVVRPAQRSVRATPALSTPTAAATLVVPPSPTPVIYTVQRGDTLGALAAHFGVPLDQLMSANGIVDDKSLTVGQQLVIPVIAPSAEAALSIVQAPASATVEQGTADLSGSGGQNVIHYVKVGETLSVIANLYGVQLRDLLMANGLAPDSQLTAGDELLVPRGAYTPIPTVTPIIPTETPTPEPTAEQDAVLAAAQEPTAEPSPTQTPVPTPVVHEVQRGDVPAAIALKYGVTVDALLAANPNVSPSLLRPGDKLVIPGTVAATATPTAILPTATPDLTIFTEHTVTAGEVITDLYVRYNVSYAQLVAYNTITNSNELQVGSVLRIPLGTPTPTPTTIPSPTVTPTPLPAYMAPTPLMPLAGADLGRVKSPIVLGWAATGLLRPDEYYVVRLHIFDADGNLVDTAESWTQTTSWRVPDDALPAIAGNYTVRWDVRIERLVFEIGKGQSAASTSNPKRTVLSERSPSMEFEMTIGAR